MLWLNISLFVLIFIILPGFRVVQQYQKGVVFFLGKIISTKEPGLSWIVPYFQWMKKVDFADAYQINFISSHI